jgi:hypothetical protein
MLGPMRKTHDRLFGAGRQIVINEGDQSRRERKLDVKNEGASGDIYENKGTAKVSGARRQDKRQVQGVRSRRRARGGDDSDF